MAEASSITEWNRPPERIVILNGENYSRWIYDVSTALQTRDLLRMAKGEEKLPTAPGPDADKAKEAEAKEKHKIVYNA